jgi:hypothetical protein
LTISEGRGRRGRWIVTALAIALSLVVALALVLIEGHRRSVTVTTTPAQSVRRPATLTAQPCAAGAPGPFVPLQFVIPGVIRPAPILALPRDANGVPSVPPVTLAGKQEFAWDKGPGGIMPGSNQGNALFNAHTWPWSQGGALGNEMLVGLRPGKVIVLRGKNVSQCYRVVKQIQVPAAGPYPSFYDRTGPSQIAIIVCSGVRAGPGDWLSRTIWFARPFTTVSAS